MPEGICAPFVHALIALVRVIQIYVSRWETQAFDFGGNWNICYQTTLNFIAIPYWSLKFKNANHHISYKAIARGGYCLVSGKLCGRARNWSLSSINLVHSNFWKQRLHHTLKHKQNIGLVGAFSLNWLLHGKLLQQQKKQSARITYHFLLGTFRRAQSRHGSGARSGPSLESSY